MSNHLEENVPKFVPTDKKGWIRDTETGAVISVDSRARSEYYDRLGKVKEQQEKIDSINRLEKKLAKFEKIIEKLTTKE